MCRCSPAKVSGGGSFGPVEINSVEKVVLIGAFHHNAATVNVVIQTVFVLNDTQRPIMESPAKQGLADKLGGVLLCKTHFVSFLPS